MCGIVGYVNIDGEGASSEILKRLLREISHRGPDGCGLWVDKNAALGHQRLSIIDLSSNASQPMQSINGDYVLTYNGEIYNYKELMFELIELGYRFNSKSDTEVVLNSLIEWGLDALLKFNGMFALAFFNKKTSELILARDRYGIKPLYFAKQSQLFIFASEQKAIFKHPNFKRRLDVDGLKQYFTFQNILTSNTLMSDVEMLGAGTYLKIKINSKLNDIKPVRYWDYEFAQPDHVLPEVEYREELDRLFQQAVRRQLVGDVELGAYLSGGIDSGSVAAIASRQINDLKTFTCGFDLSSASGIELSFDEREKAEAMSALFQTEHYEIVLKAGDMERCLPKLAWHIEEPRIGQSYPNYYAAKLASNFVKVVLSGCGGDELFGGYPWRYYKSASSKNFNQYANEYYGYWQRMLNENEINNLFNPIGKQLAQVSMREIFTGVFATHKNALEAPEDYINHSLYFEAKTFLHGLLVVEDKLSMAHGLEVRLPFLDNDLVDFAMKCPVQFKLSNLNENLRINENDLGGKVENYFQRTGDGKKIFRDVMEKYLPQDVTKREKQGFSSPDASWFRGESINFVKNLVLNKNSRIYEFFDRKTVHALADDHFSGRLNRRLLIWSLLSFEAYLHEYL